MSRDPLKAKENTPAATSQGAEKEKNPYGPDYPKGGMGGPANPKGGMGGCHNSFTPSALI